MYVQNNQSHSHPSSLLPIVPSCIDESTDIKFLSKAQQLMKKLLIL